MDNAVTYMVHEIYRCSREGWLILVRFFLPTVGTDESQASSMTDADDTQLHAVESDEF